MQDKNRAMRPLSSYVPRVLRAKSVDPPTTISAEGLVSISVPEAAYPAEGCRREQCSCIRRGWGCIIQYRGGGIGCGVEEQRPLAPGFRPTETRSGPRFERMKHKVYLPATCLQDQCNGQRIWLFDQQQALERVPR